ncbi:MAG: calycin-like domain-containing protein [Muribaculaceae bacterium]|nr:calycin-like domain-containing protein [Muribaculaceae bacterium]
MKMVKMMSALAALFMLIPAFVSCDKDDDKNEPKPEEPTFDVSKITGTYSGSLGYSVMGFDPGIIEGSYDLKIVKDADDADEVAVVLPECTFTPPIPQASSFTIPSLTVNDVDVTEKDGVYTISEDEISIEVSGVKYTGKLTGTIKDKDAKVEYTLVPGRMPMDINFTFTGTLK